VLYFSDSLTVAMEAGIS